MNRFTVILFACVCAVPAALAQPDANETRPKLVLLLAVDQFRYDYLARFRMNIVTVSSASSIMVPVS